MTQPKEDLARCPWCHEPMTGSAAVCPACGFNRQVGHFGPAVSEGNESPQPPAPPPTWRERWRSGGVDVFLDYEIPLGMIALGLLIIVLAEIIAGHIANLPGTLFGTAVIVIFNAAWMYAGMSVLETLTHGSFGPWREVALKLAAIYMIWAALGVALQWLVPLLGLNMLLLLSPILIFFLVRWLFQLDLFWTGITMVMILLTRFIVSSIVS